MALKLAPNSSTRCRTVDMVAGDVAVDARHTHSGHDGAKSGSRPKPAAQRFDTGFASAGALESGQLQPLDGKPRVSLNLRHPKQEELLASRRRQWRKFIETRGSPNFQTSARSFYRQRLRCCMNTSFSNSVTSCSFFSSAPTSGGTATRSSCVCSTDAGMSCAISSLSQSSSSLVDGFYFSPGRLRMSKNVFIAAPSSSALRPGKCTSTICFMVPASGNLM